MPQHRKGAESIRLGTEDKNKLPGCRRRNPETGTGMRKNNIEQRNQRLQIIEKRWEDIRHTIEEQLPATEQLIALLQSLDAPYCPCQIGLPIEMVQEGIEVGKEVRNRYTLLQLLWDLGLEETYSKQIRAWLEELEKRG